MRSIRLILFLTCLSFLGSLAELRAQGNTIENLKSDLEQESLEDSTRVNILNKLSEELIKRGNLPESKSYIMQALQRSGSSSFKKGYLDALSNMTTYYLHQEKADSALYAVHEALTQVNTPEDRMKFLNLEATAHRIAAQPARSLEIYQEALSLADSVSDESAAIGIQLNMATVYKTMGDFSSAYEAYFKGLHHAENEEDTVRLAIIHNNIGESYNSEEKYEEAKHHLDLSESLSYKIDLKSNLVRVYLNLGNTHSQLGNYDLATNYYDAAEDFYKENGDISGSARIYYNRGRLEKKQSNLDAAQNYFLKSLEESRKYNIQEGIFYSAYSLGELHFEKNNFEESRRWYDIALNQAEVTGAISFKQQVYEKLYQLFKKTGNSRGALTWLENIKELDDSLRSAERERIRAEYEAKFEMDRRKQDNAMLSALQSKQAVQLRYQKIIIIASVGGLVLVLLVSFSLFRSNRLKKKSNAELQLKNKQLKRLNSTIKEQNRELENLDQVKNKLFAIIAHDLKGPLGSLQSLLYLLREHELSKEELNEISHSLEVSLQENASTMDNLLAWAKAQMSGIAINEREFSALENIKAVCSQIKFQSDQKGITIDLKVDKSIRVIADYDMFKLVIRNLLANAIKFSEKGDNIAITAEKQEDSVLFSVEDEGIGIPDRDKDKIFASTTHTVRGTSNEKGSGLGLNLCKEFIEEHDSNIWFTSKEGEGTTFYFTIPAAKIEVEEPQAV